MICSATRPAASLTIDLVELEKVAFFDDEWRNEYQIAEIKWCAFLHPSTGIGWSVFLKSADDVLQNANNVMHRLDQKRGCIIEGDWLACPTAGSPRSFAEILQRISPIEHEFDEETLWRKDIYPDFYPNDDSFGVYWRSIHEPTHSHTLRFEPGADWRSARLRWSGVIGEWPRPGEDDFRIRPFETSFHFELEAAVTLDAIHIPTDLDDSMAWRFLRSHCSDAERFELVQGSDRSFARPCNRRFVAIS